MGSTDTINAIQVADDKALESPIISQQIGE